MQESHFFSKELILKIEAILMKYPQEKQKSALLPVLHLVQDDHKGWLDFKTMDEVANLLSITPIEVYEVATFYSMFNTKPLGKYVLEVCRTGPCMLNGSDQIISHIEKKLNILNGETTSDSKFSLKLAECLGACGYAPMMQLGKTYKENLTIEKIDLLIDELINK